MLETRRICALYTNSHVYLYVPFDCAWYAGHLNLAPRGSRGPVLRRLSCLRGVHLHPARLPGERATQRQIHGCRVPMGPWCSDTDVYVECISEARNLVRMLGNTGRRAEVVMMAHTDVVVQSQGPSSQKWPIEHNLTVRVPHGFSDVFTVYGWCSK